MREKKNKTFQCLLFLFLILIAGFCNTQKAEAVDSGSLELGQELNPGFIEPGRSESTSIRIFNTGTITCDEVEINVAGENWTWNNLLPDDSIEVIWDGKKKINGQRLLLPLGQYDYYATCMSYSPNLLQNIVSVSGKIWVFNMIDGRLPQCSDGIDNNGNGDVDFPRDTGCQSWSDDEEGSIKLPQCSDGLDNDGDGLIDADDLGCLNKEDDDEKDIIIQKYQCSDGIDNDGDGLIDVNDPGCLNSNDDDENNIIINPPQCASDSKIRYIQNIPDDFIFTSDIKYGEESLRVKYLQIVLVEMGPSIYPQSYISSKYYDLTENAIQNFINSNGISGESADLIGEKTASKLNEKLIRLREDVLSCGSRSETIENILKNKQNKNDDEGDFLKEIFPIEMVLGIVSQENGNLFNLNNELIAHQGAVADDFGRGLMQITDKSAVGSSVSELSQDILLCRNQDVEACYRYYANNSRGIDANVSDGIQKLKEKSEQYYLGEHYKMCIDNVDGWDKSLEHGVSCEQMRMISIAERYNSWHLHVDDNPHDYIFNLAKKLNILENIFSLTKNEIDYAHQLGVIASTVWDNSQFIKVFSPVELRVIDSSGKITGLESNEVINEIPASMYDNDNERVSIYFADDLYTYEIAGISRGAYGLEVVNPKKDIRFSLKDIPTDTSIIHSYSIDWDMISEGQDGITIKIDNNGDGTFEYESIIGNDFKDAIAPQTTIVPDIDNWQKTDAEVILFAEDNEGGIGVQKTEYSLDGGENWIEYKEPFIISEEGVHNLQYRSTDWFGNQEEIQLAKIKIDKTAPEAKIVPKKDNVGFDIDGIDNLSNATIKKESETKYIISDEAGNTLNLDFDKIQIQNKNLHIKLHSLQYNNENEILLPENQLHYVWQENRGSGITLMEQQAYLEDDNIKAHYDIDKDKTKVIFNEDEGEAYSGLKIIGFSINQGDVKFNY